MKWVEWRGRLRDEGDPLAEKFEFHTSRLQGDDADKQRRWSVALMDAALYRLWEENCQNDSERINRGRGTLFNLTVGRIERFADTLRMAGERDFNGYDHDVFRRLWRSNNTLFFTDLIRYLYRPTVYLRWEKRTQAEIRDVLMPRSRTLNELVVAAARREIENALDDPLVELGAVISATLPRHPVVSGSVNEVNEQARESWTALYATVLANYPKVRLRPGVQLNDFTELAATVTEGALLRARLAPDRVKHSNGRTPFEMAIGHIVRGMVYEPESEDPAALPTLSESYLARYLRYVEFDGAPGHDLQTLFKLQAAHLDSFTYSNLDLLLHINDLSVPRAYLEQLIDLGHGALCYPLNASLAQILKSLGFTVNYLWGTVAKERGEKGWPDGNHLGLQVTLDGEEWLVDAGLGDGPREPLPLRSGTTYQSGFRYEIVEDGDTWTFVHDDRGSFGAVTFKKKPVTDLADFSVPARLQATSPRSSFLGTVSLLKRGPHDVRILRGKVLKALEERKSSTEVIATQDDWLRCLKKVFSIHIGNISPHDRDALWRRVCEQHDKHQADDGNDEVERP